MKRFAWLSVIAITSIACSSPGTGDVGMDMGVGMGADLGGDPADLGVPSDLDGADLGSLPDGAQPNLGTLSVVAGKVGGSGNADDTGAVARFNNPQGLAVDGAGNVYVADGLNNTIRKLVLATGAVTTIAGAPLSNTSADGTGTTARFRFPSSLLLDGGDLYVADAGGNAVRKLVLATGAVTTVAGSLNTQGSTDGTGTAARFYEPTALALDAGNLYVSDARNNTIRRIVLATGAVTTVAGTAGLRGSTDGTGAAALFDSPAGLVTDGAGTLYVADKYNNTIRKLVLATGAVTTLAGFAGNGGSRDGTGAAAQFYYPFAMITDKAGSLYVADQLTGFLRKVVMSTGVVTSVSGSFLSPSGLAMDAAGTIYVSDTSRHTIRKVPLPDNNPVDLAGSKYLRDTQNGTGTAAGFEYPFGVVADASGTLYVSEYYAVRKITPAGVVTTLAGSSTRGSADGTGAAAQFQGVRGLTADADGTLYAIDTGNHTIRKIVPATGVVTTLAGNPGLGGSTDGTGSAARFYEPLGIAADAQGNLYVADTRNNTIRKVVLATGAVTTLAGQARLAGSTDGIGSAARFDRPYAVAPDNAGNLYIADSSNATVRKLVLSTGEVTTVLGAAGMTGTSDGIGTAARFYSPSGLLVSGGTLYVSDQRGSTVRKVTLSDLRVTTFIGIPGVSGVKPGPLPARINRPGAMALLPDATLALIDEEENVVLRVR